MSVPVFLPRILTNKRVAALALLAVALLFFPSTSFSATTITIPRTHNTQLGDTVLMPVQLDRNEPGPEFSSFKLRIHYTAFLVDLISVEPGDMLSGCGWEQFEYQLGSLNADSIGTITISAVANVAGIPGAPSCYLGPALGSIVNLKFHVPNDESNECQTAFVNFYWLNCNDNAFATIAGDSLYVAGDVYEWDWILPVPAALSTYAGLPNSCLSGPIDGRTPHRAITYKQGFIDITCGPDPTAHGDLNLNGIGYEIADAVLYVEYFLNGPSVFSSDPIIRANQIIASDANADVETLTFRDLTYLLRVIVGDALPFPKPSASESLEATFTQDFAAKTITVTFAGDLSGAYFEFTGDIVPTFNPAAPSGFARYYAFDGVKTHVISVSETPNPTPGPLWFSYTGDGVLSFVGTADYHDNLIIANVVYLNPPSAECGDVNYDQMTNISDAVYLISYIFVGGPPPVDLADGDVDCNGLVTVSDAVFLINYIFAGGSAPCANCPQ